MKKRLLPILIALLMLISLGSNTTYAEASVKKSVIKSEVSSTTTTTKKNINIKNIVVFIKFKGQDDSIYDQTIGSVESIKNIFTTNKFNLKNYVYQVSDGQVNVNSEFYPLDANGNVKIVELSKTLDYYAGTNNYSEYNQDILNSLGTDFQKLFTEDEQKYSLSIIAPTKNYGGGVLGSYKSGMIINNKNIRYINITFRNLSAVIKHEYMHIMNLPDLYHSKDEAPLVGQWSPMQGGEGSPTMYEKEKYTNWIYNTNCIQNISKSGRYSLSSARSGQENVLAYRIKLPNKSSDSDQYFMVEYRDNNNKDSVDGCLTESGLLVYRINPTVSGNYNGPPDEIAVLSNPGTGVDNAALGGGVGETEFSNFTLSDGTGNLGIKLSDISIENGKLNFNVDLDWNKKTTIYYKGYTTPYIHYKVGSGVWTTAPGLAMTSDSKLPGYPNKVSVDLGTQSTLTACFNNGSGTWDSNKVANYTFGAGSYSYSNGVITKLEDFKISDFKTDIPNETTLGKLIKLTATTINSIGQVKYKITATDSCSNTEVLQDYATTNTVTWKPTKADKYKITVQVKDEEGNVDAKVYDYVIHDVPSINSSSFDKASAIQVGTPLNLSVTTTGGTGTSTCKFIARGGNYAYSSKDIFFSMKDATSGTWTPDMDGVYTIVADVTDKAGIVTRNVIGTYTVNKATVLPLDVQSFGIDKNTVLLGDTVKINFNVSGGNGGNKYKIYAKDSNNVTTNIISNSTNNSVRWKPTSAGDWTLYASATDSQGNTVKTSILISVDKAITGGFKISSFVTNIPDNTTIGKTIKISGSAINNSGTVQYKISARDSDGTIKVLKDYSEDRFVNWKPNKTGNYTLILEAKDGASKTAKKYLQYFINPAPIIVNANYSVNSPQDTGTAINLFVTTTGGTGNSTCKFVAVYGTKELSFNMTSSNVGTWTPDTEGQYTIYADVTDQAGITKRNLVGNYVVNKAPITPLEITDLILDKTTMNLGDTLNFKIETKGGSGNNKYTVIAKDSPYSKVSILTDSSTNTGSWKPSETGSWMIDVTVTDSQGNIKTTSTFITVN